jgi:hypothetical protein
MKELKKRKQSLLKGILETPHVVVIEDVFNAIITKNKYPGLSFLELLKEGPSVGIHFIIGSIRTYRNLLRQLIEVYYIQKSIEMNDVEATSLLGGELIINPEELFFYREKNEINYQRFFHVNEGVVLSN